MQFANDIIIKNIFKDEELYYLHYKAKNGFIYNKEDDKLKNSYLCILTEDYVSIINLYEKKYIKYIKYDFHINFQNIIQWNNKYIITTATGFVLEKKNYIIIIDLEYNKTITKIEVKHAYEINYIKKINHPIYGEALLTCEKDGSAIKLWII